MRRAKARKWKAQSVVASLRSLGRGGEKRRPGKASLYHPAAWQQDKAALSLSMFDYLQLGAVPNLQRWQ